MGKPIKKILVVDDVKMMRLILTKGLREKGFEVEEAESGIEAIEKTNDWGPDLVLLDINLNDMSGLQVLKSIKADHPDVEVIMITAYYEMDLINQALALGAAGYFHKPIDIEELKKKIEELNQKSEEEKLGIHHELKRALVIEPFAPLRMFFEKELASKGFTVIAKGSAEEAEKDIEILKFQIAVVNANPSPYTTFEEVATTLREVNPQVIIIAIATPHGKSEEETLASQKSEEHELKKKGADYILFKPVSEEKARELLQSILSSSDN